MEVQVIAMASLSLLAGCGESRACTGIAVAWDISVVSPAGTLLCDDTVQVEAERVGGDHLKFPIDAITTCGYRVGLPDGSWVLRAKSTTFGTTELAVTKQTIDCIQPYQKVQLMFK